MKIIVKEQLGRSWSACDRLEATIIIDNNRTVMWHGYGNTQEEAIGDAIMKNLKQLDIEMIK